MAHGTAHTPTHAQEQSHVAVPEAHEKRRDIQALRALAVALVIANHAGVPGFEGGYIGVDVFFVVSGYIITSLLLRETEAKGSLSIKNFYARRARRILPASSLVLIVTVLASYQYLGFIQGASIASDTKWAAVFSANFHFIATQTQYLGAQAPPSPIQHYWSLAVEEQFYVVWPLLLLLLVKVGRGRFSRSHPTLLLSAIIVASYAWSILSTSNSATVAYFSPLTRACELGSGALIAVVAPRLMRGLPGRSGLPLTLLGLTAIVGSALMCDANTAFPGAVIGIPVLGTVGVLMGGVAAPNGRYQLTLGFGPIQWLGDISYSLYLWHWPLLIIAEERASAPLSAGQRALLVLAAVGLAAITYYAIEQPFRRSRWLRKRPLLSIAIGVVLIVAVVVVAQAEIANHPQVVVTTGIQG